MVIYIEGSTLPLLVTFVLQMDTPFLDPGYTPVVIIWSYSPHPLLPNPDNYFTVQNTSPLIYTDSLV